MGKVAVSRETSVVSHTIAFQAILAKNDQKKKTKLSRVKCDNCLVYVGKNWCWIHGEGRRGPRILFYFRIPENLRTPGVASYSIGGIILQGRKQDRR